MDSLLWHTHTEYLPYLIPSKYGKHLLLYIIKGQGREVSSDLKFDEKNRLGVK